MSSQEKKDGRKVAITVDSSRGELALVNPKADSREAPKMFTFDHTYGPGCVRPHQLPSLPLPLPPHAVTYLMHCVWGAQLHTARDLRPHCVAHRRCVFCFVSRRGCVLHLLTWCTHIADSVLEGFNGTIFAYGQTGAGKSFTMEGAQDPPELQGIIPNSFKHIFEEIAVGGDKRQFLIRASYLEIYNEEIRDLLSKDPKNRLDLKESVDSGVYVKDLTSFVVKSVDEIDHVMQAGKKNRSVGSTLMNQSSSRSHSIFTITVETGEAGADGEQHFRVGKLNMVDLAGSERQSKTGATGDRLKEATKINLSLSALGNVISALVDSKTSYIPYRDSKLTRLLQDSLGGNTKTVMIANCGPADYNYDETLSTLRYVCRAAGPCP